MSRFVLIIPFGALALMLAACSSFPWLTKEEPAATSAPTAKNRCLLESEDCPPRKMTITELIAGLKHEIARGEAVYTPAELQKLENKLRDYEVMYDRLMYGNDD